MAARMDGSGTRGSRSDDRSDTRDTQADMVENRQPEPTNTRREEAVL